MTIDELINRVLDREGEGKFPYRVAADRGGRTSWGISELAHPDEWQPGPPSRARAAEIYRDQYLGPFLPWVSDMRLLEILFDWRVNSSPRSVILALQRAVGADDDGVIGPQTRALVTRAIEDNQAQELCKRMLVYRAEHFMHLALDEPEFKAAVKDFPDLQIHNLRGWLRHRVLAFME